MERNSVIGRYIANSFCLLTNEPTHEAEYEQSIRDVASAFGDFLQGKHLIGRPPTYLIRIIFALDKTSAALSFGNEVCLVINRFFVQTLNNLNKILFHELEEELNSLPMFVYIFRLMREQACVFGFHEYAVFIEQFMKLSADPKIEAVWKQPANLSHLTLTSIQEAFIVAHEITHLLVADGIMVANVERRKSDFFARVATSSLEPETAKQEEAEFPLLHLLEDKGDDFAEELFCDQMAFEFVLQHFGNTFSYSDVHSAVRVFFMHMRVLEMFSNAFIEGRNAVREGAPVSKAAPPSMSRNWSRALQSSLSLANDSGQAVESLYSWSEVSDLHHERITGIALNTVRRKGARIWTANLEFDFETRKFAMSRCSAVEQSEQQSPPPSVR